MEYDLDYDQPSKEETDNNSKGVDISQILKKYSNVIASKPEPKAEQAGLKIDLKSNTHNMQNSAVKVDNKFTVEQEHLPAEIVNNVKKQYKTKTFPCDKCEKQYSTNWSLKQHYLKPTGEKPHKCEMCGELFALKKELNKH